MSAITVKNRGSAGITALIMMLILLSAGMAAITLSSTELTIASGYRDGIAAQYLAEAGALWALTQLKKENREVITNIQTTGEYKGSSLTNKNSSATKGTYQVSIANPDHPQDKGSRVITAVGTVSGSKAARTAGLLVNGVRTSGGIYENAVYSGNEIAIGEEGVIGGNAAAAGNISGSQRVTGSSKPNSKEQMPSFGFIDYKRNPQLVPCILKEQSVILRSAVHYVDQDFEVGGLIHNITGEKVTIFVKGNVIINDGAECKGLITIVAGGAVTVKQQASADLILIAFGDSASVVQEKAVVNGSIIAKETVLINGTVRRGLQVVAWKNHK